MEKYKCPICSDRVLDLYCYASRKMCADCICEYKAIFEGWVSTKNNMDVSICEEKLIHLPVCELQKEKQKKDGI